MNPSTTSSLALPPGVSREFLLRHGLCPARIAGDGLLVLSTVADASKDAIRELGALYGCATRTEMVTPVELEQMVERVATQSARSLELEKLPALDDERLADVRELANQPPVIRYVNLLLREASDANASDVHLEATRSGLEARFRLDGSLVPAPEPPRQMHHAVVSRLKAIAEMDIAERRRPQDGRIRVKMADRELDLRVSTVPTVHGESVVLRLLDRGGRPVDLGELGMPDDIRDNFANLITRPHGMLLVTGPTGSGKTSTLYAALQKRNSATEKIITVEDPVEYELDGIAQVPVARAAGVTFSSALRAILRQDPDVVMIGEMRDTETAEIAVQSAMTGHLVLSTLHTNDAVGAIPRLLDLGIADYLIAGTLEGVVAQRLVRRVCAVCCVQDTARPEELSRLAGRAVGAVPIVRSRGCDACRGTGYRGRTGLFELLLLTEPLRAAISRRDGRALLRQLAIDEGMIPLRAHGMELIQRGITTIEEVLRVVQD